MDEGTQKLQPNDRLVSLDALRGFDMIWIMALDTLAHRWAKVSDSPVAHFFDVQLEHAKWAGFTFYDLIFPLFIFIMGAAMAFSVPKTIERYGRATAVRRIVVRGMILFLLGLFYYGGLTSEWPHIRLLGVLQRFGLVYIAAGLMFCFLRPRSLVVVCVSILIGYWALLTFVPIRDVQLELNALAPKIGPIADVPKDPEAEWVWQKDVAARARGVYDSTTETTTGRFDRGLNLTNHLDFQYLPGDRLFWDPEGLLSTLPAIASCLLGTFAGLWLRDANTSWQQKLIWLCIAGALGISLGWLWGLQFPVIKKIWTSSYVLVAAGWSCLLLSLFYYIVDVRKWRRWCEPFIWVGMNPIALYLAFNIVDFYSIAKRFVGGDVARWTDQFCVGYSAVLEAFVAFIFVVLLARFLYQQKIFLRL
jgi:predicted acyltransferase